MLGHSTTTLTRDTYTAVFDELKHAAAAAIDAAINGARPGARAPGRAHRLCEPPGRRQFGGFA